MLKENFCVSRAMSFKVGEEEMPMIIELEAIREQQPPGRAPRLVHLARCTSAPHVVESAMLFAGRASFDGGCWKHPCLANQEYYGTLARVGLDMHPGVGYVWPRGKAHGKGGCGAYWGQPRDEWL